MITRQLTRTEYRHIEMTGRNQKTINSEFAKWISAAIRGSGKTLTVIAERAGTSHARLIQLKAGSQPSREMAKRIARAVLPDDADESIILDYLHAALAAAGFTTNAEEINPRNPILREVYIANQTGTLTESDEDEIARFIRDRRERRARERGIDT